MSTTEFDQYAAEYDRLLANPLRDRFSGDATYFARRKKDLLLKFLCPPRAHPASMSWLDIGCGTGTLLRLAGDAFSAAKGCDPSREMLQACRDLDVAWQPEPTRLPFPDSTFDHITLVCVLHHVLPGDRAALLDDVARVLRPGGFVGIIEHNPYNPVTRRIVSQTPVDRDAVLLTASESRRRLRFAGLDIAKTIYFLYVPERFYRRFGFIERLGERLPLGGQYAVFGRRGPSASP